MRRRRRSRLYINIISYKLRFFENRGGDEPSPTRRMRLVGEKGIVGSRAFWEGLGLEGLAKGLGEGFLGLGML